MGSHSVDSDPPTDARRPVLHNSGFLKRDIKLDWEIPGDRPLAQELIDELLSGFSFRNLIYPDLGRSKLDAAHDFLKQRSEIGFIATSRYLTPEEYANGVATDELELPMERVRFSQIPIDRYRRTLRGQSKRV